MKKLLIILLFVPILSIGQIGIYNPYVGSKDTTTYTTVEVENIVRESFPEMDSNTVDLIIDMLFARFINFRRDEGYYWVRLPKGRPEPAKYWKGKWYLSGRQRAYDDKELKIYYKLKF